MKKLLTLIILLVCSIAAHAVDVDVTPVTDVITLQETASFDITLSDELGGEYRIYYGGVEWDIRPQTVSLIEGESKTISLDARPLYVNPGQHGVPISIRSQDTSNVQRVDLLINVRSESSSSYLPSVNVRVNMPEQISPVSALPVRVELTNGNPLNLSEIKFNIDSDYFTHEEIVSLGPTTKTTESSLVIEELFELPDTLEPQTIAIKFSLVVNDQTIYLGQKSLVIRSHTPAFTVDVQERGGFFKYVDTITLTNEGNVVQSESFKQPISMLKALVTSETPEAAVLKEDGSRYQLWLVELGPGESQVIQVTRNYRAFILTILLIVLGVAGYLLMKSPLVILKRALVTQTEEGGINMLKVHITLRNNSGKALKDAVIYDTIPHLANYFKEDTMGSLLPSKILKNEKKGTLVKFDVGDIDAYEERIITYRIQTQLNILGGLILPEATGRFKTQSGRERRTKSLAYRLYHR